MLTKIQIWKLKNILGCGVTKKLLEMKVLTYASTVNVLAQEKQRSFNAHEVGKEVSLIWKLVLICCHCELKQEGNKLFSLLNM